MFYIVKTPWLVRRMYPKYTWQMPGNDKELYLTFDDGPHPRLTGFVLDELKRFDAGANLLAGYEFSNKLSFQLNAGLGLIRLNNRADDDTKSSIKNTGFGVSLGYRFQ